MPTASPPSRCPDCRAAELYGSCAGLFDVLLALDHERRSPWSDHHAVNVACYLLQHPSLTTDGVLGAQWAILLAFADGGLDRVHRLTRSAVRANNHRVAGSGRPTPGPAAPAVSGPPAVTIQDVAADGTFPASGYAGRMASWVDATIASRAPSR